MLRWWVAAVNFGQHPATAEPRDGFCVKNVIVDPPGCVCLHLADWRQVDRELLLAIHAQ